MRIVMLGDVVGKAGRRAVHAWAGALRKQEQADFVIVNGENAAGGAGITPAIGEELLKAGADVITLGNHTWNKREVYGYLDEEPRVLRPANYPAGAPGRGWAVYPAGNGRAAVVVLQGRTFMEPIDDPFRAADAILEEVGATTPVVIVDFHAEATSEKQAFARYVDGRASAVIGTHTHVQTADEQVLPGGTAAITDVGMCGPVNSVIGIEPEAVIRRFTSGLPARFEAADGPASVCGVVVDVDESTGHALGIRRIRTDADVGD